MSKDNIDYKALYEQELKRKEWLLFSKVKTFADGSSVMVKNHLVKDGDVFVAFTAISTQPSGKMQMKKLATAFSANEAIDAAINEGEAVYAKL